MNLELWELCQENKIKQKAGQDLKSPVSSSRVNSWQGSSSYASTRNSSQGRKADTLILKEKEKLKKKLKKPSSFKNVKEMVIDFICREDLIITTLKEFFEIFISSIKKDQVFHSELLSN